MLAHTDTAAFTVDDRHDTQTTSDRVSRYGAYLRGHRHLFDHPDADPTADPAVFAAAAWTVAQPPVMMPGYLRHHPRILAAPAVFDDEYRLAVVVEVAVPAPLVASQLASRWTGWVIDHRAGRIHDPGRHHRMTVLTRMTVRIPIPAPVLTSPRYRDGIPDTTTAKTAVRALAELLSSELAGVLDMLEAVGR